MKPRRVVLTVEVETDAPLRVLRDSDAVEVFVDGGKVEDAEFLEVLQISANVIRAPKKRKGRR